MARPNPKVLLRHQDNESRFEVCEALAIWAVFYKENPINPYYGQYRSYEMDHFIDNDLVTKLKELKKMHQEGVINETEFKLAKDKLLKK